MTNQIYNDREMEYFAVMEQVTEPGQGFKMLPAQKTQGLSYLRFEACLQTFGDYNRNRRKWTRNIFDRMLAMDCVTEPIRQHAFVGEAGHPVATTGKVSLDRVLTIDPLRCSHRVAELKSMGPGALNGIIETLDEGPGTPGVRLMKNIEQGIIPAWSARTVVPQRHNTNGTIDVIGPGRLVCYDRVYLPSHPEAYLNVEIPVKNIIQEDKFAVTMENFLGFITERSDKVRRIADDYEIAYESLGFDQKTQTLGMNVDGGRIFIAPELKYRQEMNHILSQL